MRVAAETGKHDAAACPLNQRDAQRGFEFADLDGKRGLRNMDLLGGTGEGSVFDQRLEIAQLA